MTNSELQALKQQTKDAMELLRTVAEPWVYEMMSDEVPRKATRFMPGGVVCGNVYFNGAPGQSPVIFTATISANPVLGGQLPKGATLAEAQAMVDDMLARYDILLVNE